MMTHLAVMPVIQVFSVPPENEEFRNRAGHLAITSTTGGLEEALRLLVQDESPHGD
jgi:hypothetical protein